MENFVFSSRAKTVTGSLGIVGLICLVLSYFADGGEGHHMRFWTNFLHNTVFFLGIAFMAGFALAAFTTAYAGWFVQFKRVWEAKASFLLPSLFLMGVIIVGLWLHSHHLYHWNDATAVAEDEILTHKSAFLNKWWYTFGTIGFVGLWYFFLGKMGNISRDEDVHGDTSFSHYASYKKYAAIFLPIAGFTSAALIWQWVMSLDSHWYSTMFAWYASASWFVAMTAMTIMLLIYLKSRGYYTGVTAEHFHDLGKYLFAISIFWAYLWFSQFMLIWYGNVGEETIYFRERMDNYPFLFWANLGINFLLPFFVLMRNDTKRKMGTLFFAASLVFFGHWLDFFQMIKPSTRLTLIEMEAHHGAGHHEEEHATMGHDDDHLGADHAGTDEVHGPESEVPASTGTEQADNAHYGDPDHATHGDENQDDLELAQGVESDIPTALNNQAGVASDYNAQNHDLVAQDSEADDLEDEAHFLAFKNGYTIPGLLEIGTFLGFLGGFLFFVLSRLEVARLEPKNDPYLEESLHHHT